MHLLFILFLISYSIIFPQQNSNSNKTLDSLQTEYTNQLTLKDSVAACKTLYTIGKFYDDDENYIKSIEFLKRALKLSKEIKNVTLAPRITNYMATVYEGIGNKQEALRLYNSALKLFAKSNSTPQMAAVWVNIGTLHERLGEYQKAIDAEIKAIDLKLVAKDSTNIAYYYLSLAELFYSINDFSKWEKYLFEAKKLSNNTRYAPLLTQIQILNEIGEYYRKNDKIEISIETFKKMYELSKENDYQRGMSVALSNLGPIYTSLNNFEKANTVLLESLKIYRSQNNISGITYALVQLGVINRKQKNYSIAKKHLDEGLKYARSHKIADRQIQAIEELYNVSKALNDFKGALSYFEELSIIKDSVLNLETRKHVQDMETKFESAKKESTIKLLNSENALQRNQLTQQRVTIASISLIAILVSGLGFVWFKQRKTESELKMIAAEHKMLRSQMNPHFIFNSLMAIQNYLFKNDPLATAEYLSDFASLMRRILAGSRSEKIQMSDEIKIIDVYLKLQKMRFEHRFNYSIIVDEVINIEATFIPPMLIQPFIENAVEHGLKNIDTNDGMISVSFTLHNEFLVVTVSDNGVGYDTGKKEVKPDYVSYATDITKERIDTIRRISKTSIQLNIESFKAPHPKRGTKVEMKIPMEFIKGQA